MTQVGDPTDFNWVIGSIQNDLGIIHVETMLVQCDVLQERGFTRDEVDADHKAFDKKARVAKSEIKKQIKAVGKVQLCEELLSAVADDSDTAKYLKKKIARICARRAMK